MDVTFLNRKYIRALVVHHLLETGAAIGLFFEEFSSLLLFAQRNLVTLTWMIQLTDMVRGKGKGKGKVTLFNVNSSFSYETGINGS